MKRMILVSMGVLALISFTIFIYFFTQGTPWKKASAKHKIEQYLTETYPNEKFAIGKVCLRWYEGFYEAQVYTKYDANTEFYFPIDVSSDRINWDYYFEYLLGEKAKKDVYKQITRVVPKLKYEEMKVTANISSSQLDFLKKNYRGSNLPNFDYYYEFIWEDNSMNEKSFIEVSDNLVKVIKKSKYTAKYIRIYCKNDKNNEFLKCFDEEVIKAID